ncbi:MAG: methyltransferase domain-containing protein [Gemmatimonadetes bacterium]|nr:methyltransferase domain-containing protein [Gemmatimonadota bacterium]
MSALADAMRSRVLLVLERHELTVSELCAVFQLPQSTMSRHLKVLVDDGWLVWRAEGTSRRYVMPVERLDSSGRRLWHLVRDQVSSEPAADQDAQRVRSVLAQRRTKSQEFFSTAAGEWDRLRAELFGGRADLQALLGLLDGRWTVGDLGCGTGQVSASLAPFVGRVVAVDESPAMLNAARRRLRDVENVEVRRGEVESLPLADGELDAAVLFLVLHFVPEPQRSLEEVARALKPGGRLLVVDMTPHDREEYRQRMGHVWLGFAAEQLTGWAEQAGLHAVRYTALAPDPEAKGPSLFAATMGKPR